MLEAAKPNGTNGKGNGSYTGPKFDTSKSPKSDPAMDTQKSAGSSKMSHSHPPHMEMPEGGSGGDGNNPFDIRNFVGPAVAVLSIVSTVVWFTWTASGERSAIDVRLVQLENKVQTLSQVQEHRGDVLDELRSSVSELQSSDKRQEIILGEAWTAKSEILWCLKAQLINKYWKCPDINVDPGTDTSK